MHREVEMGRACCCMGLHRCTMTIYSSFRSHLKQYPEYQYNPLIVLKRACCFFQYFFSQHLFFVAHWSEPKFRNLSSRSSPWFLEEKVLKPEQLVCYLSFLRIKIPVWMRVHKQIYTPKQKRSRKLRSTESFLILEILKFAAEIIWECHTSPSFCKILAIFYRSIWQAVGFMFGLRFGLCVLCDVRCFAAIDLLGRVFWLRLRCCCSLSTLHFVIYLQIKCLPTYSKIEETN